ncbi:MAG: cyclase family protein [Halanaerobiales bacterium]
MTDLIDVSLSFYDGQKTYPAPTHITTELGFTGSHEKEGMAVSTLKTSTHAGTHIDSPFHFIADGQKIDELPPEKFITKAVVMDFSEKGAKGAINAQEMEEKGVEVQKGDIVVTRTDWSDEMEGTPEFFSKSPYLTPDAAEWLVEKNVTGYGIDAGNVENPDLAGTDRAGDIHKILLGGGLIIIEGLTNLSKVPEGRHDIFALPLKLEKRDGAPARVMIKVNN